MQNIESVALQASMENAKTTIQPNDQLIISVSAKDMDVVKPFNQNFSSGELVQYTISNGNAPSVGQNAQSGPTYLVDTSGDINFPIIGKINTKGKTVETLKDELTSEISRYVKNPIVNVKTANFKVVVLGEVNRPGTYYIPDGNATLLSVLGLAGDTTIYGERNNILIIRNYNDEIVKEKIDITSANFINSPFYYIKQNDVIVVNANITKQKTSRLDPNTSIYIAVASILIGLIALFKK